MQEGLTAEVKDLVGRTGEARRVVATVAGRLVVGDTVVTGPIDLEAELTGTVEGVISKFSAAASSHHRCVRCLVEWDGRVSTTGRQHYGPEPDEDGYGIIEGSIDVSGPAIDELALGLEATPVCKTDCLGLCSVCGNDLNTDPCDGHGEDSDSPFAVLKDLFDH